VRKIRAILSFLLALVLLFVPFRAVQFIALLYLLTLAACFGYSRLSAASVVVRRRDPVLRAYRFEPLEIAFTVENSGPLPLPYLTIMDNRGPLFSRESGKFIAGFRSWQRKNFSYLIESQNRGEYEVGPVTVCGSDPLGMFPWKTAQAEAGRLIVYPEVLPLAIKPREGLPAGSVRSGNRIYEDVTRYRSLREYVPGDDARRINWKASAKTGRLYSMEYLPVLLSPVLVLLNLNWNEFPLRFRSHWVERAAMLAASLVMHFVALKQEVGLIASATLRGGGAAPMIRMSSAPGHATAILETLARLEPSWTETDYTRLLSAPSVDIPVRTHIEAITPRVTEDQQAMLREAGQKGWFPEVFLLGGDPEGRVERLSREFPVHVVTDYGNDLISG
jgi:uncharacterized protein (DUF58 family)